MKTRIIFTIIGVMALIFIAWYIFKPSTPAPEVPPPAQVTNLYIERIEKEIDSLAQLPNYTLDNELYQIIQYHIADGYQNNSFGSNENDNSEWENVLSEKLYFAYLQQFIKATFVVFKSTEWETSKVNFIENEVTLLQKSPYLSKGSKASNELVEIQDVIKQYYVIVHFITNVTNYMKAGSFDYSKSMSYINTALQYQNQNLGNRYVNNNRLLHVALNNIPGLAYTKHQQYIVEKVNANSNKYRTASFSGASWAQKAADYRNKIFDPVLEEIKFFEKEKSSYRVIRGEIDLNALKKKWVKELDEAITYFKTN